MKISLITLALLTTCGAAMAQSSVTLFGRIDTSVARVTTETTGFAPVAALSQTKLNTSELSTTNWGMRGVEDLGGGLSAKFVLASAFSSDTGAAGNTLFEREAHIGLVGSWGEVMLGRIYTTYHTAMAITDMVSDDNFAVTYGVFGIGIGREGVRASNAIRFDSASYSGFSASFDYGLGENAAGTDAATTAGNVGRATDHWSMLASYAQGPILLVYSHLNDKQVQAAAATPQLSKKSDMVGATYNFGVANLAAQYQKAKWGAQNTTAAEIGVNVPVSDQAVLKLGYAKSSGTGAAFDLKGKGYVAGGLYSLSKRTTLYATYYSTQLDNIASAATGVSTVKSSTFATGIRHVF